MKRILLVASLVVGGVSNLPVVFAKTTTKTPPLPSNGSNGPLVGMFFTMLIVIALAWVVVRLFLKKFNIKAKGNVDVLAVQQVVPNKFVGVIDVYGKKYVVGIGETITYLDRLNDEDIPDEPQSHDTPATTERLTIVSALKALREQYGRPGGGKTHD